MKLNKKGFTLVELLAVIIILAIVVGITIPAVLTTISNTRAKAFQTAVESVADWVERQYQANQVGDNSIAQVAKAYEDACVTNGNTDDTTGITTCQVNTALLDAAGVKHDNFASSGNSITIDKSGRACVKLVGAEKGDYQSKGTKYSAMCSQPASSS